MTARPGGSDRVLVIDATGRGHAICRLFTRTNPGVTVYYGPGCDLVAEDRIVAAPQISLTDPGTALRFLEDHPVEVVLVSTIDGLSRGYADVLRAAGHPVIGPSADAARLEASKERGKRFCRDHGVPIPAYRACTDQEQAQRYARSLSYDCVIKADELTPDGDGSIVCGNRAEAEAAIAGLSRRHGFPLLVERRLHGPELSLFALLDGHTAMPLPTALDFKRTLDGDRGKNCDGMGSVSPHPLAGRELEDLLRRRLLDPVTAGLRAEGLRYTGFLYLGVMLTATGPVVIEINARFGDSEAQVVLPGVRSDFLALCGSVLRGELDRCRVETDGLARCSVALVQGAVDDSGPGWPFGAYHPGQRVHGIDAAAAGGAEVYLAGVRRGDEGHPVTSGGRVLHVVGAGQTADEARDRAYRGVRPISFAGHRFRTDIGVRTCS
ncbi:phosphoribosylamine--glycine ligase [Actinoplanes cyaneus]|uniref:phosphoribosylamine--glycine ligase n=1 Tax=Actinoplanes cyaneus TaxID=52696 RepID=A0A919IRA0_9ACTN|nr:phosphoribosylamine--glycine ligase [Actinoplanes cyaneus]MCW2139683.1 phosphoribosylamine--glycine ligase [Actinoplanes cyaneus]GID69837.1 phosphoribosylamine--glycine ligase [Actinoplanes cyaneus]